MQPSMQQSIGTDVSGLSRVAQTPPWLFWTYLFFLVNFFLHFATRVPAYGALRPTLLLTGILAIGVAFNSSAVRNLKASHEARLLFVLFIYIVVSLPFVAYPGSVLRANFEVWVKAVSFLVFTVAVVDSPQRLRLMIITFVSCQVIRILEPLYLNVTQGYWGSDTHLGGGEFANRLSGAPSDVINANELGFIIVTTVPFLHFFLTGRNRLGWLLYISLMPLLLYALVLTMSRGAFIALIIVGAVIFAFSKHRTMLATLAALAAIGGWSTMSPVHKDRYLSLVDDSALSASTVDGRVSGTIAEFELGFNRPLFGHGLGTTPEVKAHTFGRRQASHNMYGELLIEIGMVGAAIFLRLILNAVKRLRALNRELKNKQHSTDSLIPALTKALIALFAMFAVYSFNYWGLSQWYWYFLLGVTAVLVRLSKPNDQRGIAQVS
jgi:hypothetical protein